MRSSRESRGEKKMRWIRRRRKSEDTEKRARREREES